VLCFQLNHRGAQEFPASAQNLVMLTQTAQIWVASSCFFLFAACAACGQKPPSTELFQKLHFDSSNLTAVRHQEIREWKSSYPDAPSSIPSIQLPTQELRWHGFGGMIGANAGVAPATKWGSVTHEPQPRLPSIYEKVFIEKGASSFVTKYLHPSLLEGEARYQASSSDRLMGRASFAASRIFVTRDSSGKGRLNTRYFLGALASVALHSANRPNRMQATSAAFNDFGSTVGGDAGMNVFHEFGPGIQQILKAHSPKFVSSIEERFSRKNTDLK
jgi:hypothetical protein